MYRNGVSLQASKASFSLTPFLRNGEARISGVKEYEAWCDQLVDRNGPMLVLRRHLVVSGRTASRFDLQCFLSGIYFAI